MARRSSCTLGLELLRQKRCRLMYLVEFAGHFRVMGPGRFGGPSRAHVMTAAFTPLTSKPYAVKYSAWKPRGLWHGLVR